ncbi:hypothetical protein [Azospirillum sp. TSO35-2]|uniref:dienelactone hydrolase family protein n=1 Tax=Azospirillum sp. TSO35-2 TaxID=716796 RepID=UPI000D61E130|nr:hypothetical protein [Azospirillum sp. TSO35-2]PWC36398.1 hypothetical protein TSO352_14955 [Azospirillum sp. TSO35-2]
MRWIAVAGMVGAALWLAAQGSAGSQEIKGSDLTPSAENMARTWNGASLVLPAALTGGLLWQGPLRDAPAVSGRSPVVLFMHGSSGLAPFVTEYQRWLADDLGLPSIAPDSMAIPDRLTYTSPVATDLYEKVHTLRMGELENALAGAKALPWVDPAKIIIVGTSEGAVPVARLANPLPVARVIYSWSCEANYFVDAPKTAIPQETPVLSMIATRDPYFSGENPWNRPYAVRGDCGNALKSHQDAMIVTLASNKHTILNTPQAHDTTAAFLKRVLAR